MGGGPVLEDVYVPYQWPFSGFHSPSFYAASSAPLRYYDLDVESALVELRAAFQNWPSCTMMNGHRNEEVNEARADGIRNVAGSKSEGVVCDNETTQSHQSEEVEKSVQSDGLENSGKLEEGQTNAQLDELEKIVHLEDNEETGKLEEGMEKSKQSDEVDSESRSDEERRAATMVQARYRGHLVRMSRPLVQLREIAEIEERLKKLKEQVGDGAFLESIRRKDSMAKLAFEEGTMKLLLQLDNIQGSDPLVRQIRKSVAREIVFLQENFDALLSQSLNTRR